MLQGIKISQESGQKTEIRNKLHFSLWKAEQAGTGGNHIVLAYVVATYVLVIRKRSYQKSDKPANDTKMCR